ncbi:Arabinose-binding domain of AraC transcription regulator, N-term [Delftia tsuruhatensis]|uniref:AraC family transcriptional regulator n=1 Tax=Delftia tsuruhatensis TaxID=180282 RepID=UPI001E7125D9|nr:AraC family transcriptional regulator [Delftia tsuruhatensis]CAB5716061.1 Arabinose-binding domain of AraC transcription regulator, N-term [Delftia tsuruhatensis]CAC9681261.1 Arabinose-binding domain of AraC transcription regulator, N-term [Delftia tsuruhatensis]
MTVDPPAVNLVRAASLAGFVELVQAQGGDAVAILGSCGLGMDDLGDPERYLPGHAVAQAIEEAARALDMRDFGLRLCARQGVETLGLLGLVIQSASTVRDGMIQGGKYVHFHNPTLGYRTFMTPDGRRECVEVFQRSASMPSLPQVTELCVAYMCRLVDVLSGGSIRPAGIHLRHAPVGSGAQYRRHLGMLPVFHAPFDGISIEPLAWRQPMPGHNRLLQQFLERFLLGTSGGPGADTGEQVQSLLDNLVRAGMADLGTVARMLGLHTRTLQRRLQAQGIVFEALRDGARRAWAGQLLAQPGLSLGQIAQLLGYADQSVLTRACQRWFGRAPRQLRSGGTP